MLETRFGIAWFAKPQGTEQQARQERPRHPLVPELGLGEQDPGHSAGSGDGRTAADLRCQGQEPSRAREDREREADP